MSDPLPIIDAEATVNVPTHQGDPGLRELLSMDLHACNGRTGVKAMFAALVYDPSFCAIAWHRLAQYLQACGWRRLAKLVWRMNTSLTSCHLHLDAHIGGGLYLPHPTGVVVGAGVMLGRFVTLYQHCTLGRNLRDAGYPRLGNGVTLYPGATIIGSVVIDDGVTVGTHSVVFKSLPAGVVVAGNPARVIRQANGSQGGEPAKKDLPA